MRGTVAFVGRPNVGKSTLFNRLVGKKLAIVDDTPGVTRDWREHDARLGGLRFMAMDTAGLEEAFDQSIEAGMRRMTDMAIDRADAIAFMIDARAGVTPLDSHFADALRRLNKPTILLANKCEGTAAEAGLYESWSLGLGEPMAISAEHGLGMGDLESALDEILPEPAPELDADGAGDDDEPEMDEDGLFAGDREEEIDLDKPVQLAIVGRPNAGKSTLMNALLGEERSLTGPEAGITRDAVMADFEWQDRNFKLVDTAGMRKKARVQDRLEQASVQSALTRIRLAQVVILLLDADMILDKQDLQIARHVIDEGRCLIIGINKWDAVKDREAALQRLRDRLQTSLPQVRGVPTVTISALKGQRLDKLMHTVVEAYAVWNERITTGRLNRWLEGMIFGHPPPLTSAKRPNRMRFMSQIKTRPPTFAVWCSRPTDVPDAYERYLVNGLRDSFHLDGIPIRLFFRAGDNPYAGKSKGKRR
ncbi:MAG: ribosome biogenesis GTPase Der [Alphaproteobacteria bacterium]